MSGRRFLTDKCQFGGTQMSQPIKELTQISPAAQVQAMIQVIFRKWRIYRTIKRVSLQELNEIKREAG